MTSGSKTIAIALLLLGLVLVNYLATSVPLRYDATSEKIYTLSPGRRRSSRRSASRPRSTSTSPASASGQYVEYKNYAERVREMLRQYERASGGKVRLNLIDPEPDTPEEEKATAAGIEPQTIPGGSQFYFGLVATQADQQKVIARPQPPARAVPRVRRLRADLRRGPGRQEEARADHEPAPAGLPRDADDGPAGHGGPVRRQRVGADLPDRPGPGLGDRAAGGPRRPGRSCIRRTSRRSCSSRSTSSSWAASPCSSRSTPRPPTSSARAARRRCSGVPSPTSRATCPCSLAVGGSPTTPRGSSATLRTRRRWSCATRATCATPCGSTSPRTASTPSRCRPLSSLRRSSSRREASPLSPGSTLTFTPLVETSAKSGDVPVAALQFAQPEEVARQVTPSGKRTIAALVHRQVQVGVPRRRPQGPGAGGQEGRQARRQGPGPDSPRRNPRPPRSSSSSPTPTGSLTTTACASSTSWARPRPSPSTTTSPSPPTRSTSSRARAT